MFKRTIAALTILATVLCLAVKVDAADAPRHTKDDTWLIYWYLCGSDLESGGHHATHDIAEMQQVKLPPNVKILICAGGTTQWHHPMIAAGGHGIYLYSGSHLEQKVSWNENMGDPNTLISFLEYGEENFPADHKIVFFWNHGGLNGVCYDDNFSGDEFYPHDGLNYNELNAAFADVYGNSPEEKPFELIGFKACMTGSYELASSIADFSHYMLGSEPSVYNWPFKNWIAALAKNPSMNGAQIGKIICDSAIKSYSDDLKLTHVFSVIDLNKMPELREAYEAYFTAAVSRANEEGFSGAFARAAEAKNVDKYSNFYADLGLLAKNTKSIMPKESKNLLTAIDKAVVYNKRGEYLKSKGISTYYPYISLERPPEKSVNETKAGFEVEIQSRDINYDAQKQLYQKLLNLKNLPDTKDLPLEKTKGHFVANLTPEQLENISYARCLLLPVKKGDTSGYGLDLGGAILTSADDLKVNWKKGTVTENFRAMEPVFDGHKIVMLPSVSSRGHTFYRVPIIYDNILKRDLLVRYDTSTKKYEIIGFGSDIENGMVRASRGKPDFGHIITPLNIIISDDPSNDAMGVEIDESTGQPVVVTDPNTGQPMTDENGNPMYKLVPSIINQYPDPNTGKTIYLKYTKGTPFVFTRDSAITNKQITRGDYLYLFAFTSPGGYGTTSQPGFIDVEYGKVTKLTWKELENLSNIVAEDIE